MIFTFRFRFKKKLEIRFYLRRVGYEDIGKFKKNLITEKGILPIGIAIKQKS